MANDVSPKQKGEHHLHQGFCSKEGFKENQIHVQESPRTLKSSYRNGRMGELGTASMIEFINGSFIESIPTSEEAGRSESLSLLVIDEAAIVRWASTIWAAAAPAISTGGSAILNSCITGNTKIITDKGLIKVKTYVQKHSGQ